jgi:DNA-binding MltR family transcriptional regulator
MENDHSADDLAFLQDLVDKTMEMLANALPGGANLFSEINLFRQALNEETDRGCALMSAAFMEDRLGELIAALLVDDSKPVKEMLSFSGALGTFSSRINMSYLLRLIPKNVYRELHLLRKIRNSFAHTASSLKFETEEVKVRCNELVLHGRAEGARPRAKFTRSMMCILSVITVELLRAEHRSFKADHDITPQVQGLKELENFLIKVGHGNIGSLTE